MTTLTHDLGVLRSLDADWNRQRWEALPDDGNRYEVIDGVLYMTTAPKSFHQWIVRQVSRTLYAHLDDRDIGITLCSPIGLFMPGCDPVQPDILFIRTADLGIMYDGHVNGVPALLIEILSRSNPKTDLDIKRAAYARAGVPEYWIVRPASRDMLVYSLPNPPLESYAHEDHIAADGTLISPMLPVRVEIAGFFAGAPDTTL